jgi:ribosomal protein L28
MPLFYLNYSRMLFSTRYGHHVRNETLFRTDHPSHSRKSQKGLFHLKTHGPKNQVSFSGKKHPRGQKPNVKKKTYYSELLDKDIKLWVSTTAMKNIVKAGSFDNYILNTHPSKLNSKLGMFLRDLMKKRQKDPDFELPYIPFSARVKKRPRKRPKYLTNLPMVYVPAEVQKTMDLSIYHEKNPEDMTREELAHLEKTFQDPDSFLNASEEWKQKQPYYQLVRKEILTRLGSNEINFTKISKIKLT